MIPINTYVLPVKVLTEQEMLDEFDEEYYNLGRQCQFCKGYKQLDTNFGACFKKDSLFKNRIVLEHFTCKKHVWKESETTY